DRLGDSGIEEHALRKIETRNWSTCAWGTLEKPIVFHLHFGCGSKVALAEATETPKEGRALDAGVSSP
ncbi:MAG: hypothetical protein C4336_02560, partial [Armatimonadota bacterium]